MSTPRPEGRPPRRQRMRLPFENKKQDAGEWAYDHRLGLSVMVIVYLVLGIAFFASKIVIGSKPHMQGIYVDLQTLEELEANAEEAGFRLYPVAELNNAAHTIGGVKGTREALRWAFGAEKGEVSHIFEAGDNDHLMVFAVADIHEAGYRPVSQMTVLFRVQALNDKKADKIMADAKKVKSMDEALALANVKSDTLRRVTFSSAAYVSKVPASENVISGVASGLEEGAFFGPIKGNGAVYFVQVSKKGNGVAKFDAATEQKNKNEHKMMKRISFPLG